MSSADRRNLVATLDNWKHSLPWRYGIALTSVIVVSIIRHSIGSGLGFLPPFSVFFPMIIAVALWLGFGPGIFATILSVASIAVFFWAQMNVFGVNRTRNTVGLILFSCAGTAGSVLAGIYRKRAARLLEVERAVEGVEEGIVIVDRQYRYVVANRALLGFRGLTSEQLVGHSLEEIIGTEPFETIVKPGLEECFSGKVVKFEKRYKYPRLGERDFAVSYFPIEGPTGIDRAACIMHDVTDLKETERALGLFRALIDQSNDAVFVIDPDTLRFLDVNEKACLDLGYSREDLLSFTVFDINPELDESMRLNVRKKLAEAGSVILESTYQRKDGSRFPVEFSLKRIELDRIYHVAIVRDITERKRAQHALQQSEDRYRDLVEHSDDLVCTHDLDGNLLSVNPAPARMLGYEVDELMKIPMREVVAPEFRNQFDTYLARIKANKADKGTLCVVSRAGERRIWEYNNTLRSEGVPVPIVRGIAHDVTEQRKNEDRVRRSERRYRMLFEKTVAGVAVIGMDGRVIDCNDAWARMFGHSDAAICRGCLVADRYPDPARRAAIVAEVKRSGAYFTRDLQLLRTDGTPFWVLLNSVLLDDGRGETAIQSTIVDITARKEAEDALRRKEKDYRSFVARSSEGIFRQDLDRPVSVDLPEDELVHHILNDSYMAECNDAMARMYGFVSGQELLGKRLTEMLVADDPNNIAMTREYIQSGFQVLDRKSHEVDINGNPKVFRNSMIGIVEQGKLIRTWGIQRDVTEQEKAEEERTQAEKALRKSEEHFRILVEQASDGIFIADPEGNYVDVNSAGAEMLGYTRDEILQFSIKDIIASEEIPRIADELSRVTSGKAVQNEWKFRRKDGSFFPGEVAGRRLPDGRLQGILRDISERRNAEEEMRRNEERFRVALKESPITVFNQDCDLKYTWLYNPQLYWQHDAIGKTDEEILGPKKAASLVELKRRVLETGLASREEVALPHNGRNYAFDLTIEPLFDAEGRILGITGASVDIARLRELTDRLQDAKDKLTHEKSYLEGEIQAELGFEEVIGQSSTLRDVLQKARVVAPTDSTVLLLGETGTGKELVARSVHSLSLRRNKTFIKLNCAAVPSGLLESELFGHEKGAFTGAVAQKVGRIELADKGTLFLDEIGELPSELQPKLLRVLQDREFERLGGVHTLHVDARIISATNRDLQQDIADKTFREDLYYRLNVFPIQLPALRERRDDIPMLVHHFVRKHAMRMRKNIDVVPDETMAVLQGWNWPGNIRELENMIERMVILTKGSVLAAPPVELDVPQDLAEDNLTEMEREHIIRVLRETNGVLSGTDGAASRLGVKRTTLQSMLKRFKIELHDFRRGNGMVGPG